MTTMRALRGPVQTELTVTTTEMHTGGEPVRILESGYPVPQGATLLDKIQFLKENCDDFRKFVIWEPRGHVDMYGVLVVAPDNPEADFAVIFLHNEGFSTMCGHVVISIARYAVDRGMVRGPIVSPETPVKIQTPCGLIKATVKVKDNDGVVSSGRVGFESVPSFVLKTDLDVPVKGLGTVQVDVVYGGAFYAFVTASDVGITYGSSPVSEMKRIATAIKEATKPLVELSHPTTPAFLYGVIFVDSRLTRDPVASTTVCIYAAAAADRSPCGSGTTSYAALQYHRGLLAIGETQKFKSGITGSEFTARPVRETSVESRKAITIMVEGHGFYSGSSTFTLEKGDTLGRGFLV